MSEASKEFPILKIEMWHGFLLLGLALVLVPLRILEPWGLFLGGLFMGLNLLLLSFGIRWVLTPFSTHGRVKAGVVLLVLKLGMFLALLSFLFWRIEVDAPSFAVGVSCLLAAIILERLWALTSRDN